MGFVGSLISYGFFGFPQQEWYPWYMLSTAITRAPASCVGSFGVSIAALGPPLIGYARFVALDLPGAPPWLRRFSLGLSIVIGLSAHGVASFQYTNALALHVGFAGIFFVTSNLYAVVHVILDKRTSANRSCATSWRLLVGVLAPVLSSSLGVMCMHAVFTAPVEDAYLFDMCMVELSALVLLLSVHFSFFWELRDVRLQLLVATPNVISSSGVSLQRHMGDTRNSGEY